jgi:hypothetical protein
MTNSDEQPLQQINAASNIYSSSTQKNLQVSKQDYGDKFQDHLIEQYKLYVEMMDRISSRRNQMNTFYLTLLSGLLALISIFTNKDVDQFQNIQFQAIAFLTVSIIGLLLCLSWYINIQSYKRLNSSKFKVIYELEKQLPFSCYTKEWELLKEDKRYKNYLTQSNVEKILPIILAAPYVGLFVYCVSILQ